LKKVPSSESVTPIIKAKESTNNRLSQNIATSTTQQSHNTVPNTKEREGVRAATKAHLKSMFKQVNMKFKKEKEKLTQF